MHLSLSGISPPLFLFSPFLQPLILKHITPLLYPNISFVNTPPPHSPHTLPYPSSLQNLPPLPPPLSLTLPSPPPSLPQSAGTSTLQDDDEIPEDLQLNSSYQWINRAKSWMVKETVNTLNRIFNFLRFCCSIQIIYCNIKINTHI